MKKRYVLLYAVALVIGISIAWPVVKKFWASYDFRMLERERTYFVLRERELRDRKLREYIIEEERRRSEQKAPSLLEKKKQKFIATAAVSFIYVNKKAIADFYNTTFKEPTIESMMEKLVERTAGKIESGLAIAPILKSELGGENLKEYIKTIKFPETTVPEMFLRYQRHVLENNKVRYGFDEIEIRLEEMSKLEKEIADLENRYGISFSEEVKKATKLAIKRKLVDEAMAELEKVDQWVLVEGKYKITNENEKVYRLTYEHPINKHSTDSRQAKVQFICFLAKDLVESVYKAQLEMLASKGGVIPINIFGKVLQPIDRETNNWELTIISFAIY